MKVKTNFMILPQIQWEPVRKPFGPLLTEKTTNSKCCCIKDNGNIKVSIRCNKNLARNGEQIIVQVCIDNSQGNVEIKNGNVILEERRVNVFQNGTSIKNSDTILFLGKIGKTPQGKVVNSIFKGTIPMNFSNYTAIGSITARFYVISVKTNIGTFSQSPEAQAHIILQSSNPKLRKNEKKQPPSQWNPQAYPKVICNNMKPFCYQPLPGIPYRNQNEGVKIMENGKGIEPYFSGDSTNQHFYQKKLN